MQKVKKKPFLSSFVFQFVVGVFGVVVLVATVLAVAVDEKMMIIVICLFEKERAQT